MTDGSLVYLPPTLAPLAGTEQTARGGYTFSSWQPSAQALTAVTGGLVAAAAGLERRLTTSRLLESLGAVAEIWLDRTNPHRLVAEQQLAATTGFAPGMVAEALDRLFDSLRAERLAELLRVEVGHLHAAPPRLVLAIAAGTVFPPAIVTATVALLLRSAVLIKTATAEPILAPLWARSLETCDPDLAGMVAVLNWSRSNTALTTAALAAADAVVVHGDRETVIRLRAALPERTRFVAHGPKVSAAILSARALAADSRGLARTLAREVALYEQQGCLSPHTVFIEERAPDAAREFAGRLAAELELIGQRWPRAPLEPARASALRQFLGARELAQTPPTSELFGGFEAGFAVLLDHTPHFEFSPLGRTVIVKPVASVAEAGAALTLVRDHLQAVGLAVPHADRLALAGALGLYDDVETNLDWVPRVRLCPVQRLQSPPVTWPADGHRPLGSLCPRPD